MRRCAVPLVFEIGRRDQHEWIAGPPSWPVLCRCTDKRTWRRKMQRVKVSRGGVFLLIERCLSWIGWALPTIRPSGGQCPPYKTGIVHLRAFVHGPPNSAICKLPKSTACASRLPRRALLSYKYRPRCASGARLHSAAKVKTLTAICNRGKKFCFDRIFQSRRAAPRGARCAARSAGGKNGALDRK